jgi:hypothetical protein
MGRGQCAPTTTGTPVAGGVLRLRPQRTMPSIIAMPPPEMSPSCTRSTSVAPAVCSGATCAAVIANPLFAVVHDRAAP